MGGEIDIEKVNLKDNDDINVVGNGNFSKNDRDLLKTQIHSTFIDVNKSTVTATRTSFAEDTIYEKGNKYELTYETKVFDKTTQHGHFIILSLATLSLITVNIVALIFDRRGEKNTFFDYVLIFLIIATGAVNLYYVYDLNVNFELPSLMKRIKLFSLVFSVVVVILCPWSYILDDDKAPFLFFTYALLSSDIFFVAYVCYGITIEALNIKELIDTIFSDTRSQIIIDTNTKQVKCYSFKNIMVDESSTEIYYEDPVQRLMSHYGTLLKFSNYISYKLTSFMPLFILCTLLSIVELFKLNTLSLDVVLNNCAALLIVCYAIILASNFNKRITLFESKNSINVNLLIKVFGFEVSERWLLAVGSFLVSLLVKFIFR
jgi:hypothetical protein